MSINASRRARGAVAYGELPPQPTGDNLNLEPGDPCPACGRTVQHDWINVDSAIHGPKRTPGRWQCNTRGCRYNPVTVPTGELLTADEHAAMDFTAQLFNLLCKVVGKGRSRTGDLAEIAGHIHNIQHVILAQAAARAYPDRYRLLGDELTITKLQEDPDAQG